MHEKDLSGIYQGIERRRDPVVDSFDRLKDLLKDIISSTDSNGSTLCTINNAVGGRFIDLLNALNDVKWLINGTKNYIDEINYYTTKTYHLLREFPKPRPKLHQLMRGKRIRF